LEVATEAAPRVAPLRLSRLPATPHQRPTFHCDDFDTRGNDQTSDQTNAALDTPQRVRHSSPSFSTKVMQPTFRPHRKKRARKIGYRARMATPGGRKVIRARRLKGRKRLTVV